LRGAGGILVARNAFVSKTAFFKGLLNARVPTKCPLPCCDGCAVAACRLQRGGNFTVQTATKPTNLPASPSVRLIVTAGADGADEVLADVRSAVLGQLMSDGRFSKVVVANEPTDLVMNVDIIKYAKVTVGERMLVGALAGRNRVNLAVKITQPGGGGSVIEAFEADGESASHPLSSESGMSDAVREAAKELAAGVTI
jgi:hypothetical protein